MIKPTIHLNGTSRESLNEGYRTAYRAVQDALQALSDCCPNARDYYPQSNTAFDVARAEHIAQMDALRGVRSFLHELVLHTMRENA